MTATSSKCKHQWREMSWQEAYPASSGRVCDKCGVYRLGWFGRGRPDDTPILVHALSRKDEAG